MEKKPQNDTITPLSNRELAKHLIDQIPERKLPYVIAFLEGAIVPDKAPNAETLAAFAELDNGGGHKFSGSTDQLFSDLVTK